MIASLVLLTLTVATFEAYARAGTPRGLRRPLRSLTVREHLVQAWRGAVELGRTYESGRPHTADKADHRSVAVP